MHFAERRPTTVRMKLQHFAEGDILPETTATDGATQQPAVSPLELLTQGFDALVTAKEQPPETATTPVTDTKPPEAETQQPQQPDGQQGESLILGKYKTVADVVTAYQNVQGFATKTSQEKAALQQSLQALQAELDALKQQPPAQQAQQTIPGTTENAPASEGFDLEAFNEAYYENPAKAILDLATKVSQQAAEQARNEIMSGIAPLQQREEERVRETDWVSALQNFQSSHSELPEFIDDMGGYLKAKGLDKLVGQEKIEAALAESLTYAKGLRYSPQQLVQQTNPDDLLKDQSFISKITANPDIKNAIIAEYLKTVRDTNNALPNQLTGKPGFVPVTPPKKPTTVQEGTKMFASLLGMNQQ